jgi:hypothetical protein
MPMEDRNVLLSKATLITVLLFVSTLSALSTPSALPTSMILPEMAVHNGWRCFCYSNWRR